MYNWFFNKGKWNIVALIKNYNIKHHPRFIACIILSNNLYLTQNHYILEIFSNAPRKHNFHIHGSSMAFISYPTTLKILGRDLSHLIFKTHHNYQFMLKTNQILSYMKHNRGIHLPKNRSVILQAWIQLIMYPQHMQ